MNDVNYCSNVCVCGCLCEFLQKIVWPFMRITNVAMVVDAAVDVDQLLLFAVLL